MYAFSEAVYWFERAATFYILYRQLMQLTFWNYFFISIKSKFLCFKVCSRKTQLKEKFQKSLYWRQKKRNVVNLIFVYYSILRRIPLTATFNSFSASISSIYDVFISYNWAIIDQVAKFDEKLEKKTGLRIWRDVRDLTNSSIPLTAQLADAIRKSNLIVCFITKQYCQSHNCNLEVDWANTLKKPLVVVMIEKLDFNEEISVTGFNYNSGIPFIIKYL